MKKCLMATLSFILLFGASIFLNGCQESGGDSAPTPNSPNSPTSTAWTYTTPAGITVSTERSTITQYNSHWEVNLSNAVTWKWEDIDWLTLDEAFEIFKCFYCNYLDWNCKDAQPYELKIYIKPWDSRCVDAETPSQPYEIYEYVGDAWQCVDGWLSPGNSTIFFHMGDDPGTDHDTIYEGVTTPYFAFEETALPDELRHFFQMKAGRPMENNNDPMPPSGPNAIHCVNGVPQTGVTVVGYTIILPGECDSDGTHPELPVCE